MFFEDCFVLPQKFAILNGNTDLYVMHLDLSIRPCPVKKKPESYYRLKENYRDIVEVVCSRILLAPGFVPELTAEQRKQVA